MVWIVFLALSLICLLVPCIWLAVVSKKKDKKIKKPLNILVIGFAASAMILFVPLYLQAFRDSDCGLVETVFIAAHNVIRLILVDGEFSFVVENLVDVPLWVGHMYSLLLSVYFVLAPLLTFSFVLSFFKNINAFQKYWIHRHWDIFVFSRLNEQSLALARSLAENETKNRFFIFTDVDKDDPEIDNDLVNEAENMGAVCFEHDMLTADFSRYSKRGEISLFAIGEDESDNVTLALKLLADCRYGSNANLYIFTTRPESEILLAHAFGDNGETSIRVRRINGVRSLVARNLYDKGYESIFQSAQPDETGLNRICAMVFGMGQLGTEMVKALPWFCQMDGYRAEIHGFDRDEKAEKRFVSACPELMDAAHNGVYDVEGEAQYWVEIHPGVDVEAGDMEEELQTLPPATYILVALGNDELNIATALRLRMFYARQKVYPVIQAVVADTAKKEALVTADNTQGDAYNIDYIGDRASSYSEEVILDSDVEEAALARHLRWGAEADFWKSDYNYKSSVASVIHRRMKELCGIPGIFKKAVDPVPENKPEDCRSEQELWAIRRLEHNRWNAYMRSEGFIFGGTIAPEGRRKIAKTHNFLVPFDMLPLKEQRKDDD